MTLRCGESGRRWIWAVTLMLLIVLLELTFGVNEEARQVDKVAASATEHWALKRFRAPVGALPIPERKPGQKRLLYLSNSHARTGGFVPRHLQRLLDALAPGEFDVLDMADAGIFAPDMLQRFAAALDYQPDALVLQVAYISFSDRMKLARQSHTARSFF